MGEQFEEEDAEAQAAMDTNQLPMQLRCKLDILNKSEAPSHRSRACVECKVDKRIAGRLCAASSSGRPGLGLPIMQAWLQCRRARHATCRVDVTPASVKAA